MYIALFNGIQKEYDSLNAFAIDAVINFPNVPYALFFDEMARVDSAVSSSAVDHIEYVHMVNSIVR